jgi:exopolyphosphatase/guanosine-5'-triphosphate,3'-diphosphate pyrophosphatase
VIREVLELSGQNAITVSGQGIREGLFYPYLFPEADHLAPEVRRFSVENLVRRYYDHPEHNQHVQQLSLMLFDQLADLHGYGSFERDLLRAAALLHDIGMAINYYDHHKHSFFLVMSMALPGFSHREQAIIALLVRYHRKGAPTDQGLGRLLEPLDMTRVTKLAALLRLAEYLERSKAQKVKTLQCHLAKGYLQIVLGAQGDAHVEVKEANLHSDLLAMAYGLKVEVVQTPH